MGGSSRPPTPRRAASRRRAARARSVTLLAAARRGCPGRARAGRRRGSVEEVLGGGDRPFREHIPAIPSWPGSSRPPTPRRAASRCRAARARSVTLPAAARRGCPGRARAGRRRGSAEAVLGGGDQPSRGDIPAIFVMAGPVPATHAVPFRVPPPCGPRPLRRPPRRRPAWVPGTSPGRTAEGERRGGSRWRRPAVARLHSRDFRHGRACPGHPRRAVPRPAAVRPSPSRPPPGVGARDEPGRRIRSCGPAPPPSRCR